jgi:hypothetical protein
VYYAQPATVLIYWIYNVLDESKAASKNKKKREAKKAKAAATDQEDGVSTIYVSSDL